MTRRVNQVLVVVAFAGGAAVVAAVIGKSSRPEAPAVPVEPPVPRFAPPPDRAADRAPRPGADPLRRDVPALAAGQVLSSQNGRLNDKAFHPSDRRYDDGMLGVATGEPRPLRVADAVVTDGIAAVRYNQEGGPIARGDRVTSSSRPGEAMRAGAPGMVLGDALEDGREPGGTLRVRVRVRFER